MAYDMNCKGVTVYRDGSRDNQVLSTGATDQAKAAREGKAAAPTGEERAALADLKSALAEKDAELDRLRKQLYEVEAENLQRRAKRSRPDKLRGTTIRKETPLGVMFVNITEDDRGQPFEVFVTLGKAGGSAMADVEAMGRLMSLALRSGIPIMEIHRQLRGISSERAVGLGPNKVLSVPDAIGLALEEWWRDRTLGVQQDLLSTTGQQPVVTPSSEPVVVRPTGSSGAEETQLNFQAYNGGETFMGTCPDCGSQLEYAEGC